MEELGSHWTDFHEIWYWSIFRKFVEKRQGALKSAKNSGYFTCKPTYIYNNIPEFFWEWEIFQTKSGERIVTHILYSVTFSRKSYCLWDNVEKYGRDGRTTKDNIKRRMRVACWITVVTNTHSEYVILAAFLLQQCLHERASILRLYVHCLFSFVHYFYSLSVLG